MKHKFISIFTALVLALSLSLVTAVPVAATTIDVNNTMSTADINGVIAAATDGDVIVFAAGTYTLTEPLVVGVSGVTLKGAGDELTIIDAAGKAQGIDIPNGEGVSRVTLQDFKLINANKAGIRCNDVSDSMIKGVTVEGCTKKGIAMCGPTSGGNTITDTVVKNNGRVGIEVHNSPDCEISGTTVTGNGGGGFGAACGIDLRGTKNCTITNCDIRDNYDFGGIWAHNYSSDCVVHYSNIVGNSNYGVLNEAVDIVDATNNWWGDVSGPSEEGLGTGNAVSENVLYKPWLKAPYQPTTPMSSFTIDHAKVDFKKKADDDKVRVQGKMELDLIKGDDVAISEDIIVTVGPLSETIKMERKGKKGDRWHYQRPKGGEGDIKHMTINWKNRRFDIRMDKADLSGVTNPVTISIQIGDDAGEETIQMRVKKHHWDYKAK